MPLSLGEGEKWGASITTLWFGSFLLTVQYFSWSTARAQVMGWRSREEARRTSRGAEAD